MWLLVAETKTISKWSQVYLNHENHKDEVSLVHVTLNKHRMVVRNEHKKTNVK